MIPISTHIKIRYAQKRRLARCLLMICLLVLGYSLGAQDLHFSQFMRSPLSTNPANTGFIPDADYRIGGQYRNQFSNIMSVPYNTYSVFADGKLMENALDNGWLGVGGLLMSDVAGAGSLRSNKLYASVAYHQLLGNASLVSAGFNLGYVNKSINPTALKFPDQFDGRFFDSDLPTSVVLENTSVHYFDLQAGINYAYFPNDNLYLTGGYSLHHVNQARETFFGSTSDSRIPMRQIGFASAMIKLNNQWIVQPSVFHNRQAGAGATVLGLQANYNLDGFGEKQLIGGLWHRFNDAVFPMVGMEVAGLSLVYTYDVTMSGLRRFNNARGAHEISLLKKSFYAGSDGKDVKCPHF
jgi:type IX secretion system PorP/SprF family membrane protein